MLSQIGERIRSSALGFRLSAPLSQRLETFRNAYPEFKLKNPGWVLVRFSNSVGGRADVKLELKEGDLYITMQSAYARWLHRTRKDQLFATIVMFLQESCTAPSMTFNLSDGEAPSQARFAASSYRDDTIPIPDEYFFSQRGFSAHKEAAKTKNSPWKDRDEKVVWRGGPVGTGVINPAAALSDHPGVVQRLRFAYLTQGTEIDVGFVHVDAISDIWPLVYHAGLAADPIPEETWLDRKYAIDIDGFTNTWSNLFIRMCFGCCVLKVASQYGYRQWYYDRLKPYEHFVPVKADMSDLFTQLAWVRANPDKAEEIAMNGQALANTMTYETEMARAAQIISENWSVPTPDPEAASILPLEQRERDPQ